MHVEELKEYFVTFTNAMDKLGLTQCAYLNWRMQGYIPYHQQRRIEKLTKGELKATTEELPDGYKGTERKKKV